MEFKRWRLSATSTVVNAGLGLALLFSTAACSKPEKASESPPQSPSITTDVELPAVWATRTLDSPVSAIALSGGSRAILAVAYETGGLQFFDMEAERLGEPTMFRIKALAGGQSTNVGGTTLTVFPGVTREGEVKAISSGMAWSPRRRWTSPSMGKPSSRASAPVLPAQKASCALRSGPWAMTASCRPGSSRKQWRTDLGPRRVHLHRLPDPLLRLYQRHTGRLPPRDGCCAADPRERLGPALAGTGVGSQTVHRSRHDHHGCEHPRRPQRDRAGQARRHGRHGHDDVRRVSGGVIALAGEVEPGKNQVVFVDPSVITLPKTN